MGCVALNRSDWSFCLTRNLLRQVAPVMSPLAYLTCMFNVRIDMHVSQKVGNLCNYG